MKVKSNVWPLNEQKLTYTQGSLLSRLILCPKVWQVLSWKGIMMQGIDPVGDCALFARWLSCYLNWKFYGFKAYASWV